ncbi:hypothetical protein BDGGKGIB_00552 [Nodularia sphaerocarpa UHCC 0038]|nr:hypothetical protein BDGGKGIB_00552 [Nodularia sphaerocarpa UHCC 0038]
MCFYAITSIAKHDLSIDGSSQSHHCGDQEYAKINYGRAKPLNKYA